MNDKIITGVIENMDTGEKTEIENYFFFPNYELISIVLVKNVECYDLPDSSIQVDVDCKALDSIGMVFDLNMTFIRETSMEKTSLLFDMDINSVHLVSGHYSVINKESIVLHDPEYRSVEPDFKDEDVRGAFRINEKHKRCQ
jgi:hypothetical protein